MFKQSFLKSALWIMLGVLGVGISAASAAPEYMYVSIDSGTVGIKRINLDTLAVDTGWGIISFSGGAGPRHLAADDNGDIHVGFRSGYNDGNPNQKQWLQAYDVVTQTKIFGAAYMSGTERLATDSTYIYTAAEYAGGIGRVKITDYTADTMLLASGGMWTSNRARGMDVFGNFLYVAHSPSSGTSTVQKINLADSTVSQFDVAGAPFSLNLQGLVITADGTLMYVADRDNNKVYTLQGPNGATPGTYVGILADATDGLAGPESLAIDSQGRIWVGNTANPDAGLYGFNADGTTVTFFKSAAGIPRAQGLAIPAIPEPATMSLLGIGGLLMITRRRR